MGRIVYIFTGSRNILLTSVLVLLAVITGCEQKKESPPAPFFPVVTVQAVEKPFQEHYAVIATVKPYQQIDLVARVNGYIVSRNFTEGGMVKCGDILYKIEPDNYKLAVDNATAGVMQHEAELQNAQDDFNRINALHAENIAPAKRFDAAASTLKSAQAMLKAAQADLAMAELQLSYTDIVAPFDGWIGLTRLDVGSYVASPAQQLATIMRIDPVRVEFNLADAYLNGELLNAIAHGRLPEWPVRLFLPESNCYYPLPGVLRYWENQLSANTSTLTMQAEFTNPEHLLLPGMYVKIELTNPAAKNMIFLSRKALRYDQGRSFVYIVNAAQVLELRMVELGDTVGDEQIVKNGIGLNDRIALPGNPLLRPGAKVIAEPAK